MTAAPYAPLIRDPRLPSIPNDRLCQRLCWKIHCTRSRQRLSKACPESTPLYYWSSLPPSTSRWQPTPSRTGLQKEAFEGRLHLVHQQEKYQLDHWHIYSNHHPVRALSRTLGKYTTLRPKASKTHRRHQMALIAWRYKIHVASSSWSQEFIWWYATFHNSQIWNAHISKKGVRQSL